MESAERFLDIELMNMKEKERPSVKVEEDSNNWGVYSTVSVLSFPKSKDCKGRQYTIECLNTVDRDKLEWGSALKAFASN